MIFDMMLRNLQTVALMDELCGVSRPLTLEF